MADISIANGIINQLITGGHHPVSGWNHDPAPRHRLWDDFLLRRFVTWGFVDFPSKIQVPSGKRLQFAIENGPFSGIYQLKMVIFQFFLYVYQRVNSSPNQFNMPEGRFLISGPTVKWWMKLEKRKSVALQCIKRPSSWNYITFEIWNLHNVYYLPFLVVRDIPSGYLT